MHGDSVAVRRTAHRDRTGNRNCNGNRDAAEYSITHSQRLADALGIQHSDAHADQYPHANGNPDGQPNDDVDTHRDINTHADVNPHCDDDAWLKRARREFVQRYDCVLT